MKAISPIIAIIIILLITIAIAGAGYSYISVYWTGLLNKQIQVLDSSCYPGNQGKIIIKNIGTSRINTSEITVIDASSGEDITSNVSWNSNLSDSSKVLEFRFEENAGITAIDTSGTGNHGTLKNETGVCFIDGSCPEWVNGKVGGALEFDGDGDYVLVENSPSLNMTYELTFEGWIRVDTHSQWQRIISRGIYIFSPVWELLMGDAAGKLYPLINTYNDNVYIHEDGMYNIGDWTHVAVTYDRSNLNFYKDGSKLYDIPATGDINTTPGHFYIGGHYVTSSVQAKFNGAVDEFRVYDRALGPDEIRAIADNSIPLQSGETATLTHACTGMCNYNLMLGGSSKEAMLEC